MRPVKKSVAPASGGPRRLVGVLLLVLLATSLAWSEDRPTPDAASVPIAEIGVRAEAVAALIRTLDEAARPTPEIEAVDRRITALGEQLQRELEIIRRALGRGPTLAAISAMNEVLQTRRRELTDTNEALASEAARLGELIDRAAATQQVWARTREEARRSGAPAPVLEQIAQVLRDLEAARKRVQDQRANVLVLQNQVAQALSRCDDALHEVAAYRRSVVGRLFARDSSPVWSAELRNWPGAPLDELLRRATMGRLTVLHSFAATRPGRALLHLGLIVALAILFRRARRHVEASPDDRTMRSALRILQRPYSAALILGIVVLALHGEWPRVARDLATVVLVVPLLRILGRIVGPPLVNLAYGVAFFFVLDRTGSLGTPSPLFEQGVLLVEMLGFGLLLAWQVLRDRVPLLVERTGLPHGPVALTYVTRGMLVAVLVSLGAAALGYTVLARLIGGGAIGASYLALAFYATVRVADVFVAYVLRVRPLTLLAMVRRHRDLIQARIRRILGWLGTAGWLVAVLDSLGLMDSASSALSSALGARLTWGAVSVSLGDILTFVITVWASFLFSSFVRFVLEEDVYPRIQLVRGLPYALSSVLHYAILLTGFWVAIAAMGVDLTKVTILAGAFGVGIGFGLQNVVNNFVSGLILLFERPIHVGDIIKLGDVTGEVRRIGIRSSTVWTGEGAEVIVPNGQLIAERVTNWTLSDRRQRVDVPVRVPYGTPPDQVIEILLAAARAHPQVLDEPAPMAMFVGFGDTWLNFEVRLWTEVEHAVAVRSEIGVTIYEALTAAGIQKVPFPPREVQESSAGAGLEGALRGSGNRERGPGAAGAGSDPGPRAPSGRQAT
jgi:potassium efflux system protein